MTLKNREFEEDEVEGHALSSEDAPKRDETKVRRFPRLNAIAASDDDEDDVEGHFHRRHRH